MVVNCCSQYVMRANHILGTTSRNKVYNYYFIALDNLINMFFYTRRDSIVGDRNANTTNKETGWAHSSL
jgi:hypothetical protein